jgi:two-component system, NarL family, nitrate/nitrite response regulator NarL
MARSVGNEKSEDVLGRVLIVDDHRLFAEAIQPALHEAGIDVIAVVDNAREALQSVAEGAPDLVLMDIGLPQEDGIEVGKTLLDRHPETKVLIVTARTDPGLVRQSMRAGFNGYVTKDTPITQFVAAVKTALAGDVVVPKHLARQAAGARSPAEEDARRRAEHLTRRELEVLTLLTEGATSEDIAARLTISLNTVRTHIQNILTKLQVRSRLEAAAFAVRFGIVNRSRHEGRE